MVESKKCTHIMTSGKNKGKRCIRNAQREGTKCWAHVKAKSTKQSKAKSAKVEAVVEESLNFDLSMNLLMKLRR